MESRMTKISARGDKKIQLKVIPGHFATPQSHITHYLDLTTMRSRSSEALRVAEALAANYETSIPVDTIICMSGLEVVGAYLAETLTRAGVYSMNSHQTIYITAPEYNNSGQIIFRESILYYGGTIRGIAAIFSAATNIARLPVYSIFDHRDLPNYGSYPASTCPLCAQKQKLDALVNGFGYSKI